MKKQPQDRVLFTFQRSGFHARVAAVVLLFGGAGGLTALQACSGRGVIDDPAATQNEPLSRNTIDQPHGKNAIVPVCWEPYSDPGLLQQRDWVRQAIEKSWMTAANVRLTGWHPCPPSSPLASYITVKASNVVDGTSSCAVGKAALDQLPDSPGNESCGLTIGSTDRTDIEGYAVHEFGHVMGYEHEQDQDAGFADENYIYPYQGNSPCSPGGGYWNAQADAYVWAQPDGAPVGFNNDLITAYDPDSIMNYCHEKIREWSGRLSILDIQGIQQTSEYGAPVKSDMDSDGYIDLQDNCPYASNGGLQLDSNYDSELIYATTLNPSCGMGWCEDGHTPTFVDSHASTNRACFAYALGACLFRRIS